MYIEYKFKIGKRSSGTIRGMSKKRWTQSKKFPP